MIFNKLGFSSSLVLWCTLFQLALPAVRADEQDDFGKEDCSLALARKINSAKIDELLTPDHVALLTTEILKNGGEITHPMIWEPFWDALQVRINQAKMPLAHGTRMDWLRSTLDHGLDHTAAVKPSTPGDNYFFDLRVPGGFMGSYAFATWGDFSDFSIAVDRIRKNKKRNDIVARYIKANTAISALNPVYRWLARQKLISAFKKYAAIRGKPVEPPAFLVYDVGDEVKDLKQRSKLTGEVSNQTAVPPSLLRFILVPAKNVTDVQAEVTAKGLSHVLVLPIEIVELDEIVNGVFPRLNPADFPPPQ